MNEKIPLYVLNNFMKFERRLYSLFDIKIGRAITFKSIGYFGGAAAFVFLLSLLPIIGSIVAAIPLVVHIGVIGFFAHFMSDVGTENRAPVSAFRSFLNYRLMKLRKESYYQGKIIVEQKPVKFTGLPAIKKDEPKKEPEPIRFDGFGIR